MDLEALHRATRPIRMKLRNEGMKRGLKKGLATGRTEGLREALATFLDIVGAAKTDPRRKRLAIADAEELSAMLADMRRDAAASRKTSRRVRA